mgnify:CR=1 FL=1
MGRMKREKRKLSLDFFKSTFNVSKRRFALQNGVLKCGLLPYLLLYSFVIQYSERCRGFTNLSTANILICIWMAIVHILPRYL